VAKLDKRIRPAFTAALTQRIADGTLPPSVAVHDLKGKLHLRLSRYEVPPPPLPAQQVLAGRLLDLLRPARRLTGYPLPQAERVKQAGHDPGEKVVKTALA